jgi:ATP-dependent exoDNAse (exonuclease V) beta subunit
MQLKVLDANVDKHISYSSYTKFKKCPHQYRLVKIDKVPHQTATVHSVFGNAIHETIQFNIEGKILKDEMYSHFNNYFLCKMDEVREQEKLFPPKDANKKEDSIEAFQLQAKAILEETIPALYKKFGNDLEIVEAEHELYEDLGLDGVPMKKFKGFIDLIFRTSDGRTVILDWKTTTSGWMPRKRTDTQTTYQLALYKHFYCRKTGIDPTTVDCYFALLKRRGNKNRVEFVEVKVGLQKMKNAVESVENVVQMIGKGFYPKNRMSCTYCDFKRKEHCP